MTRRKMLAAAALVLVAAVWWHFELLRYGARQAAGQLRIVWEARPVEEVMADAATPDSVREALRFIGRVRRFAVERLGLLETENYRTYYDQQGREIMWVVTACEPYRLQEHTWDFPIVGQVPYKGFLREELAQEEALRLKADSLDVSVRNPDGWSTLGWFRDPILSGMLMRDKGDLASLIIHELAHATIFVRDSVSFNENLASFIGDQGALLFLAESGEPDSAAFTSFIQTDSDYRRFSLHMVQGARSLDTLYERIAGEPVSVRRRQKEERIRTIVEALDTISFHRYGKLSHRYAGRLPNNATFMSFLRYHRMQQDLSAMWTTRFDSDLTRMIRYFRDAFPED